MISRAEALALPRLPGNTPWESALIQRWIADQGAVYDGFDFNYRLGTGLDPGPSVPESIRRASVLNTQKRIDCLAYAPAGVFIVEAKIVLDFPALGQFQGYQHLYERDAHPGAVLGYVAVAHAATPDTVGFLRGRGVTVYLYPEIQAPAGPST